MRDRDGFLTELKDLAFVDYPMPWSPENRTSKDWRFASKRTEWKMDLTKIGIDQKGPDLVFKYPQDPIPADEVGTIAGMEADKDNPDRINLEEPKFVNMTFSSIAQESKLWRQKLELPENPDIDLLGERKLPETDNRYWRIIDGALAASVYDKEGKIKLIDDGEGLVLLFAWLTLKDKNNELSSQAYENLINRARYLNIKVDDDSATVDQVLEDKPSWGEIPFDNIRLIHIDNFGPMVNDGRAVVATPTDTTDYPRRSVHFFLNGMVEDHGVEGLTKNSWEKHSFGLITAFADDIKVNGLPDNTCSVDTYWKTRPGIGFEIPKGSVLVVRKGTDLQQYVDAGIECVEFDPEELTMRQAIEAYFKEHNLPYLTGITDKEGLSDEYPRFNIPAPSYPYHSGPDGSMEHSLQGALWALSKGKEISQKEIERPSPDGQTLLNDLASWVTVTASQQYDISYKRKKLAHACGRQNVREHVVSEYFTKEQDIGFLEMLFKVGLV